MDTLSRKYTFLIIFLLILIGVELRLAFIDLPFWYDEAQSVLIAKQSFPFGINDFLLTQDLQHTPFYFYILHFWINLFGESDVALKILSLIFGICSIPLTYVFARKITSQKVALILAGFMTFNSFNIIYSTEVRMYSLVMMLTILSMIFLFDFLKKGDKKSLVKLAIINILIPYTLTGAVLFVVSQIVAVLIFHNKTAKIKKYLISNLLVFLALIPYLVVVVTFALKRSEFLLTHVTPFELSNIFGIFQNFLTPNPGTIFWATLNPFFINFSTLLLVFVPLFLMVYFCVLAIKSKDKNILFIFFIILFSIFIVSIFAINKTIVLAPRYLIFISPLLLLIVSVGVSKLSKPAMVGFLIYYSLASMFFVFSDIAVRSLKRTALFQHVEYINSKNLTSKDMVMMPFASSVIGHYLNENSPQVPRIEAIQELRIYDNKDIYSLDLIKDFKTKNLNQVFQNIILSDNYISENFHQHILKTFVNPVEKDDYILLAVFAADAEILMPEEEVKKIYSDFRNVEANRLNGILAKYYIDIHKIIQEKAKLINTDVVNGSVYFLYQKN